MLLRRVGQQRFTLQPLPTRHLLRLLSEDPEVLQPLRHGRTDDGGSLSPPLDLLQLAAVLRPSEGRWTPHLTRSGQTNLQTDFKLTRNRGSGLQLCSSLATVISGTAPSVSLTSSTSESLRQRDINVIPTRACLSDTFSLHFYYSGIR